MKIKLILMMIMLSSICLSQKKLSYVSCDKDTVLLPNNELGMKIYLVWLDVPANERPFLALTSESYIDEKNKIQIINYHIKDNEYETRVIETPIYDWVID